MQLGFGLVEALGRVFHDSVAHLMRTRELHDALQRLEVAELDARRPASARRRRRRRRRARSWIDIIALNARVRSRTSSTVLPFTAADIIDADDWLIEQPWPAMRTSVDDAVVDVEVDDDLVAAQRVEALDPVRRAAPAARPGSGGCGSGRG